MPEDLRYVDCDTAATACYQLMRQLRPRITSEQEFLSQWRRQRVAGYRLLAFWQGAKPIAIAGFRIQENFVHGVHLYVDDLVTDESIRSRGVGALLMKRLAAEGQKLGCAKLLLDTPLTNTLGHRFYYRQGLMATALRFGISLIQGVPLVPETDNE